MTLSACRVDAGRAIPAVLAAMWTWGLLAFFAAAGVVRVEGLSQSEIAQYVHLMSHAQEVFVSSSVFIVNGGNYESLPDTLLMSVLLRTFSRKSVLSQTMNFTKLSEEVNYYDGRSVQPLFVVMLRTLDDVRQFAESTRLYHMSLHTWLTIFMASQDPIFNDLCRRPRENLFNLVISSKMLVLCAGQQMLKEWYSIDGNGLEVSEYAVWRYPEGIEMIATDAFHKRRSDFKGTTLRVSGVKDTTKIPDWNSTINGFFGIVLSDLGRMMNFTVNVVSLEDNYGTWNAKANRWNGVIGKLVRGETDIGIGEFTLSQHRDKFVDFSIPLMLTVADLYIRRPTMASVKWSSYIKAFHIDIWMLIVMTILISPIFLAYMWKVVHRTETSQYLMTEYLNVWGIFCQKPLPEFPSASSLRIAYFSIFTSSLVLFAIYSAYLTSYLTIFSPSLPFTDYEGFIADGTYKLIILRHSHGEDLFKRATTDELYARMGTLMKPTDELPLDIFNAVQQVCNENVVLYTNQLFIEKISRFSPCELMPLTQGRLENVGFALAKNSPYTELINYNLKNLRAFGITECLKHRYFRKFIFTNSIYFPVSFWEVIPIVVILSLGFALSVAILFCEHVVYDKSRLTRKNVITPRHHSHDQTLKSRIHELEEKIRRFRLALLILASVLMHSTDGALLGEKILHDHVLLTIDIKDFFKASSVVNVHNDKQPALHITSTMFTVSRTLSDYGVLSQSMRLSQLSKYVEFYACRTTMPLYVVTLKSRVDLEEFSKFASDFQMSQAIWLVFFYDSAELLEFCRRPGSNKFNVAFDTKIVIKCQGDSMVREWYSLRPGQVKINDIARWTREDGFVLVNSAAIWTRRNTLEGIDIRIATVVDTPSVVYSGLFGNALLDLSEAMNFTVVLTAKELLYGHFYEDHGNWSGVIGLLVNRQADIGVALFGRSKHRLDAVDLAVPLLLAPMNLLYKVPNMTVINWSTYLRVFDKSVWAINAFFSIFCATLIAIIMTKFKRKPSLSDAAENCFYIWGIQCQQGLPEFPSTSPLKLAFISVFITSMVTYITYSATLTSYLTLFSPSLPFTNEKEFLEDVSYKVIVLRDSLYYEVIMLSNDKLAEKMRARIKPMKDLPTNMFEAYRQVCNEKVVLYTNKAFVSKKGAQIPCKITSFYTGRLESVSYALTKRSPYSGLLNYYIEKFRIHGILNALEKRNQQMLEVSSPPYLAVSICNVTPILTLYLNGVLLSLLLLLCERSLHRWAKSRRRQPNQRQLHVRRQWCI